MNGGVVSQWLPAGVSLISALLTSGGLWAWVQKRESGKDAMSRLLMGLAYDKIQTLGMSYLNRGWISISEYEDFRKYLYEPYKDFGGNGVAEQIMQQVSRLPMRSNRELATSVIVEAKKGDMPQNVIERQDV